jgi:hypothetical protein
VALFHSNGAPRNLPEQANALLKQLRVEPQSEQLGNLPCGVISNALRVSLQRSKIRLDVTLTQRPRETTRWLKETVVHERSLNMCCL